MSSLADRLRALTRGTDRADRADGALAPHAQPVSRADVASAAARVLGGDVRARDGRVFVVVERDYPLDAVHGVLRIGESAPFASRMCEYFPLLAGTGPAEAGPHDSLAEDDCGGRLQPARDRLFYLDLETTGLAGGAGTHAFLVGCAWFVHDALRVRQYVMTGHADEPTMLDAVSEDVREAGALVTYNGKTFDVPVLDMRYQFHRRPSPLGALAHLDMLPTARRLWRGADDGAAGTTASCSLSVLEGPLCGVRRAGDVPGFEIPSRYFHFVRTGDAEGLEAVLEHNRLDLLSLAMLTARALRLVRAGADGATTARECFGLGRVFERAGRLDAARACYARAGGLLAAGSLADDEGRVRAEALRAYALLCRRERQHAEAAGAWERVVALRRCPPPIRREASEALAVHYEHRAKDLETARRFAMGALVPGAGGRHTDAVRYRLARLERKMGVQQTGGPETAWMLDE